MNQTERKKQAVLDVTFRLLNEKPIKDITVDEIAGMAQVSKVTLFKYFGNKNHLMNVVILKAFETMAMRIQSIMNSEMNFTQTYQAITDMELLQLEHFSSVFQENMMAQYSSSPDFFNAETQVTQLDIYQHLLAKGREEGKIYSEISDDDFFFIIRVFTEGMKGLSADYLLAKAAFLTRFFVQGLE